MKALCKTKPVKGLEFTDVPVPACSDSALLLKIYKTSICGSDIPVYNYTGWAPQRIPVPFIPGHELCGEVVEMGKNVKGFKKGDFVSVESHIFCGHCYQCLHHQEHVCSNMKVLGLDCQGGFAEYAAVPAKVAWKHKNNLNKDIGSIMEPLGNAVFATLVEPVKDKSVLILGLGPQGLFAAQIARACGAQKIIGVEASAYRQKMALNMGCDAVFSPADPDVLKKIIDAGAEKSGIDVVLEMSGNKNAVILGLHAVKPAGRFTAFGLPGEPFVLDYSNLIVFKGIKVQGITGREIFRSWEILDDLLEKKLINPAPVITHTFEMKDFEKAFALMQDPEHKCGKIIMTP